MKKTILSFILALSVGFSFGQSELKIWQDFQAITLDQDTFRLAQFFEENPSKKVAIEFYFSDSPLCKETSPVINDMYERFGNNEGDLFFLSVNAADSIERTEWYRDTLNIDIPMVPGLIQTDTSALQFVSGDSISQLFQIQSYPTFIMLQKEVRHYPADTVYTYDADSVITDTTYIAASYRNIILQDIWPLPDADSLYNFLEFHLYDPSGLNDIDYSKKSFSVYPNPTSDYLNILSSEIEGEFEIDILDLSGKLLFSKQDRLQLNEAYQINQLPLKRGLYILRLRNQKESYSEKLIIQ